ncbi:hypothetical protein DV738_g4040, partial [Chaetothyriales sp. CBS 135597]
MDFLKSAVASAIAKSGGIPYSIGDCVDQNASVWALHNGTKREDGSRCSVFVFDINASKSLLPLARNAVRKLRTLRHPGVVRVLDVIENETTIYLVTERVTPLNWYIKRGSLSEETIKWGLHSIASTLKFINGDASSVHGSVRASSVYTSESGEWKLGGFEALSSLNEDDAVIYTYGSLVPDSNKYAPPEVLANGWSAIKKAPLPAADAYGLGELIYEAFNRSFTGTDQLPQPRSIPASLAPAYKRLISANPKVRISAANFLDQGKRVGSFFNTPLISITERTDNLGLMSVEERDEFVQELDNLSEDFPEEFFKMKILPELLKSVEFGGGGPIVFGAILKIGLKLPDDEFEARLAPVIIRLFQSPDRAMRVCLLDSLPAVVDRLSQKDVSNKIWPAMVTGFTDTAPVVREQTVKAVLPVISKLSDRTVNGELLRLLAKTANDEQPGIRANTTICLGKISRNLGTGSRAKVLTAAFTRSLRDPFVHARSAALMALNATIDLFSDEDCATKLLPALCACLIDREKMVRDQANKTFDTYMQRVQKYASTLSDTALPAQNSSSSAAAATAKTTSQNDTSWTGWAVSSFTNKLTSAKVSQPEPKEEEEVIEDSLDAWGEMDQEDDAFFDAPSAVKPAAAPAKTTTPFDDGGEPDFAGWLAAQSKAKSGKPTPKGLTKTPTSTLAGKPNIVRSSSAGPPLAAKAATTAKASLRTLAPQKPKEVPKPKELKPAEDDDWGAAWD